MDEQLKTYLLKDSKEKKRKEKKLALKNRTCLNPRQVRLSSSFFPIPLENGMIALQAALCPHIKHSFRDVSEHQLVRRPLRAKGWRSRSRLGASRHRHTHFELRRRLYPALAPPCQTLPPPPPSCLAGFHVHVRSILPIAGQQVFPIGFTPA